MSELGFRGLRRRQPLLRGHRRLHPPHRPLDGQAVHAVGGGRRQDRACWSGGKVNKFIPNPTFDPIAAPGTLEDYFRGRNDRGPRPQDDVRRARPDRRATPTYRDRDARVRLLDEQGLEAALLFPTLGVGMQEALRRDVPALHAAFEAFNRWLDDDWGYDRGDGRLYAAPDDRLRRPGPGRGRGRPGARRRGAGAGAPSPGRSPTATTATCRPATPASTASGRRSPRPACPWCCTPGSAASATTAGSGGRAPRAGAASRASSTPRSRWSPSGPGHLRHVRRPDLPRGAGAVPDAAAGVDRERRRCGCPTCCATCATPTGRCPSPSRTTRSTSSGARCGSPRTTRTTWQRIKDEIGIERLLFGSDFPHTEGLPEPTHFVKDIPELRRGRDPGRSCATTCASMLGLAA